MPRWFDIKAYRNRITQKRRGRPTEETEHPTMGQHPGSREADPETGEKPAPVKKPRVKKPKTPQPGSDTPSTTENTLPEAP